MDIKEQMVRATAVMRQELNFMRSLVRAVANDNTLDVRLGATSHTSGKVITIAVPIKLGLEIEHDRRLCGERDDGGVLLCEACQLKEDVFITLIHEVSHHVYESITPHARPGEMRDVVRRALAEAYADRQDTLMDKVDSRLAKCGMHNYYEAAGAISPNFKFVLNALDDVRVNSNMMRARNGTRRMFAAQLTRVFRDGVVGPDGEVWHWRDRDPDMQAAIALFCVGHKVPINGYLHPKVVADITGDPELVSLAGRAAETFSMDAVANISAKALRRLKLLGYMLEDEEDDELDAPPPPPEEEDDPQESDPGDASEDDSKSDDADPGEDDDESDDGSGDDDASDDAADDEEQSDTGDGDDSDDSDVSDDGSDESGDAEDDDDTSSDDADSGDNDSGSGSDEGDDSEESEGSDDDGSGDGEDADDDGQQSDELDDDGDRPSGENEPEQSDNGGDEAGDADTDPLPAKEDPESRQEGFERFTGHDAEGNAVDTSGDPVVEAGENQALLDRVIEQTEYYDGPSATIGPLRLIKFSDPRSNDDYGPWTILDRFAADPDAAYLLDCEVPERVISKALAEMRLTFADNAKHKVERNLKRGKRFDKKTLGRRVATGDNRVFTKRTIPGKKSWFVLVGLDVSGSTAQGLESEPSVARIRLVKEAGLAYAELLSRVPAVEFAVYLHSGSGGCDITAIKEPNEPWNMTTREALSSVGPYGANVDGHTLEYYRKVIATRNEERRILVYFTDGDMPQMNKVEETVILKKNLAILRDGGVQTVGVGVETDSPIQHGMDTIPISSVEDVPRLVRDMRDRIG